MQKIIFSDIDGTLLDSQFPDIIRMKELVEKIVRNNMHLIFCSSKTEWEQNEIKSQLNLHEPIIVENGGATIVPMDYFSKTPLDDSKIVGQNYIIETGGPANKIRSLLNEIRTKHAIKFKGVNDLTLSELSNITELDQNYAKRMMKRKYSETIVQLDNNDITNFANIIQKSGLKLIPGSKYFDITYGNDKGTAVRILMDFYRREYQKEVIFIGIGDSKNDEPMLSLVDIPMLVQKHDGSWQDLQIDKLQRLNGIGPKGWEIAFEQILKY